MLMAELKSGRIIYSIILLRRYSVISPLLFSKRKTDRQSPRNKLFCLYIENYVKDMNQPSIKNELESLWKPIWIHESDEGDILMIVPLMFHVALYINPTLEGGCEDRYCLSNAELARLAASEYLETGEMRYWQKWHNQNISVIGCYAYPAGAFTSPENALYEVDWDTDELRSKFPYR